MLSGYAVPLLVVSSGFSAASKLESQSGLVLFISEVGEVVDLEFEGVLGVCVHLLDLLHALLEKLEPGFELRLSQDVPVHFGHERLVLCP